MMYSLLNTNLEEKTKYKSMIEEKIKQGFGCVFGYDYGPNQLDSGFKLRHVKAVKLSGFWVRKGMIFCSSQG